MLPCRSRRGEALVSGRPAGLCLLQISKGSLHQPGAAQRIALAAADMPTTRLRYFGFPFFDNPRSAGSRRSCDRSCLFSWSFPCWGVTSRKQREQLWLSPYGYLQFRMESCTDPDGGFSARSMRRPVPGPASHVAIGSAAALALMTEVHDGPCPPAARLHGWIPITLSTRSEWPHGHGSSVMPGRRSDDFNLAPDRPDTAR